MPAERLTLRNPSAAADIRVLASDQLQLTDEFGNRLGIEWNAPRPDACVAPMQTAQIVLAERRKVILETSAGEDLLIPITNSSLIHTLRVSQAPRKGGDEVPLGFIAPCRNGIAADGITAVLNSKQRVIVLLMPK